MFGMVGGMEASVAGLAVMAARSRPVARAESRLLEVPAPLAPLFPEGGVRKGATVAIEPMSGGCSVALSLAASVTAGDGWAAAVGLPSLGLVAAAELGVDLRRLALVPAPGEQWPAVVAALVDGFDLLMVRPTGRVRAGDARRLMARVRERGAVMLVVDTPKWPESPDLRLTVGRPEWEGLGAGHGCLTGRRLEVEASGRRVGGRERRREVWLPAVASGRLEEVAPGPELSSVPGAGTGEGAGEVAGVGAVACVGSGDVAGAVACAGSGAGSGDVAGAVAG